MLGITQDFYVFYNNFQVTPLENFDRMLELWFLFCTIWSLGGGVDGEGRKKIDNFIREMDGQFPSKDTVYEYFVDPKTKNWVLWEEKLKGTWRYPTKLLPH